MADKRGGWNGNDASREKREPIEPATDLACELFVPDPHSRFCDRCGYEQRVHRRSVGKTGE